MGGLNKGSKETQKTHSEVAPPAWSLQNHKTAAADALGAYNQGYGRQVYQGNRVAKLDPLTEAGIDRSGQNAADYGSYLQGFNKRYAGQPSYQEQYLQPIAAQDASVISPAFQQGMQNQLNYARDKAQAANSGLGMQGGSTAAAALGRTLGQTAGDLYAGQYNQQLARKMTAAGQMEEGAAARNALLYNAANQGNVLNNAAIAAGQLRQAQAQNIINADRERFQETQDAPWRALALLNGATNAADDGYNITDTTQTKQTKSSPLQMMGKIGSMALGGLTGFNAPGLNLGGRLLSAGLSGLTGGSLGAFTGDGGQKRPNSGSVLAGFPLFTDA